MIPPESKSDLWWLYALFVITFLLRLVHVWRRAAARRAAERRSRVLDRAWHSKIQNEALDASRAYAGNSPPRLWTPDRDPGFDKAVQDPDCGGRRS